MFARIFVFGHSTWSLSLSLSLSLGVPQSLFSIYNDLSRERVLGKVAAFRALHTSGTALVRCLEIHARDFLVNWTPRFAEELEVEEAHGVVRRRRSQHEPEREAFSLSLLSLSLSLSRGEDVLFLFFLKPDEKKMDGGVFCSTPQRSSGERERERETRGKGLEGGELEVRGATRARATRRLRKDF